MQIGRHLLHLIWGWRLRDVHVLLILGLFSLRGLHAGWMQLQLLRSRRFLCVRDACRVPGKLAARGRGMFCFG